MKKKIVEKASVIWSVAKRAVRSIKMRKLLVLAVLASIVLSSSAFAANYISVDPFILSVTLDGLGPLKMRFDTGADHTLVSLSSLKKLSYTPPKGEKVKAIGIAGCTGDALVVLVKSITVDNAKSDGPFIVAILEKAIQDAGGEEVIDGLLGRDILARFDTTIKDGKLILFTVRAEKDGDGY